jgi:hypothetical protein
MLRPFRRAALAAAIFSVALGCNRSVVQQNKQPPDPLLVSKKPVEGKPTSSTNPRTLVRVDPQPPAMPGQETAFAASDQANPIKLSSDLVVRPDR